MRPDGSRGDKKPAFLTQKIFQFRASWHRLVGVERISDSLPPEPIQPNKQKRPPLLEAACILVVEQVRHENGDSKAKSAFWEGLQPVRTTEETYPTPPKRSQSPCSNSLSSVPQTTLELMTQGSQTDREIDFAPDSLDLDSRQSVFPAI